MMDGHDRGNTPGRSSAPSLDDSMRTPGRHSLTEQLPPMPQQQPQGTPLSSGGLKGSMTQTMRHDVPAGLAAIDPALGSEQQLSAEGLVAAKLIYVQECERVKAKAPGLGARLPLPAALTEEAINRVNTEILECTEIGDSMAEVHWEEHQASARGSREDYIAERHGAERQKAASAWAQAAAPIVQIMARARRPATTKELLARRAEPQDGRDHSGRVGYLLMTTETDDVMRRVGVNANDQMTGRAQGAGALAAQLPDLFSGAACHKDARDMCDLLSQRLHAGPSKLALESREEVPSAIDSVASAVAECPGPVKVLKLSVYNNHSVLYVIGAGGASRHETVAATDSKSIMINDLIRNEISLADARQSITAGVTALCTAEGRIALEYEVHQAADLETVQGRTRDQLGDRMTQLGVGMAVGSWEMADLHERQQDALDRKKPPEYLDATYGVGPIAKRQQLKLPVRSARGDHVTFYELASATRVTDPQAGAEYRIHSDGSWMRAKVAQIIQSGEPAWLYPMLDLNIIDVKPQLADPVVPVSEGSVRMLAMWNGFFSNFRVQDLKEQNLTGREFVTHTDDTWVVLDDSAHATKSMTRNVKMVKQ